MYQDILGRPPESAQVVQDWSAILVLRGEQEARALLLGTAEYFQKSGGTAASFLGALYLDVLGRAVDAGGLAAKSVELAAGVPPRVVASETLRSVEADQREVSELFDRVLGRNAGVAGLNAFVPALQRGAGYELALAGLVGSPEYQARG